MIRETAYFTTKAFRFLSAEVRGLHAAAYVLAACALLSSLLALVRDRLLAHAFGASATLDIYYAGFRIPDLIFVATGALVSVYILIPELVRRDERAQKDYIDTIVAAFSVFACVVSGAAAIAAPQILHALFPVYTGSAAAELVLITRLMLLQPILLGLSNILAAITQARHRYTIYALSPLLYNIGIIIGIVFFYPLWGLAGLAGGVVLGAALHLLIQLPSVVADGFFLRMPLVREPRALVTTVLVSVPRALALSMNQVVFLGLTALASSLTTGSIAVFMFAYNLQAVPLSIIGASYSVAAFPTLALALSKGDREQFIAYVATAARYVIFWSIPASVLILVLRAYIVRVILGSGAFDWTDTRLTAAAFALLALSLAAQGVTLLIVRGYYAAGRTFVPFVVSCAVAAITLAVAYVSLHGVHESPWLAWAEALMRVEGLPGTSVLTLAGAYAFASVAGALVLAIHFEMRFRGFIAQTWRAVWESCIAALAGGLATYIALATIGFIVDTSSSLSVFLTGLSGGVVGLVFVALAYYLLDSREYKETFAAIQARLWRRPEAPGEVRLATPAEEQS